MSYSFGMYFTPASTYANALKKANIYTAILAKKENLISVLEDNRYCFPSSRYLYSDATEKEKSLGRIADKNFLYHALGLRFVYFSEAKLLGLVGDNWPEAEKIFKLHFPFQNSCDQNYERDDWEGVSYFENIYDEFEKMTDEEFLALPAMKTYVDDEPDINSEWIAYYKKTLAYEKIFGSLKLDKWLYGHDSPVFTRFSMSPLTNTEQVFELETYLTKMFK